MDDNNVIPIKRKPGRPKGPHSPQERANRRAVLMAKNNKPASGLPAAGDGWGGPAKGDGAPPVTAETAAEVRAMPSRMPEKAVAREILNGVIYDIATDPTEFSTVRVMAANSMLDRIDGKAVSRSVNYTAEEYDRMTDDELDREIARLQGGGTLAAERAPSSGLPEKPSDVVH